MTNKGDKKSDDLEAVPGIGKSIAKDLRDIGISRASDLVHKDPQKLYDDLCKKRKTRIDPCVLYVFRCAVYFAEHDDHNPELLKWWNWKDHY
ncbi:MAG: Mitomycin resistance protein mcrB [Bacteroidales bacterium]|nr:Mitomycin resistance protein mcrB [Bacteroidales bacterium]